MEQGEKVSWLAFFSSADFMPHGHCFLWRPDLMLLHIASDSIIALAYYSIPFALLYFVHKRPDVLFRWVAVLFGIFILACGTTHVLGIIVLWDPIYWVDGGVKAVTAVASIGTALLVWRVMPTALAVPSAHQLQQVVASMEMEVATRQKAEKAVRELNTDLAERVRLRTAELEEALKAKEILLQELHHRVKNNLQVAAALLAMQAQDRPDLASYFQDSASRIDAMGRIHDQLHRASDMSALDLGLYLQSLPADLGRIYGRSDIKVNVVLPPHPVRVVFDAANPVVLILNEALSNVFKHAYATAQGGEVTIAVVPQANDVLVTVADRGRGLKEGTEGQGSMGMRLMKMLSRQVGASLSITGYGSGTKVSLLLPAAILVGDPGER